MNCAAPKDGKEEQTGGRRVVVFAYGNTLRGDDGLGSAVGERLEKMVNDPRVRVEIHHQLAPELADDLKDASLAVFIDANVNLPAGQIELGAVAAESEESQSPLGHHLGPPQLLALARLLGNNHLTAWQASIGPARMDIGEELSPAVIAAVPKLARRIEKLIVEHLDGM
ncbi:MAG: hydrogenase maturation protease [Phycisphaeraceae bacterium]|nr:hydrogenase maturation protease [Phycisphaeraceae bacterium]